jgi:hypothetical protein
MKGIPTLREIIGGFSEANICLVMAFDDEALRTEVLQAARVDLS